MVSKEKEKDKCSLFEEMLMWTSYRYCIGRKTYVISMARDIASHYYDRLTDDRMEFTAMDIRKEIMDNLRFLPCDFSIDRMYNNDAFNPIDTLLTFIEKENIDSMDAFTTYAKIRYDSNKDTYSFERKQPTINSYFSSGDIDDLIPWENLAACFDKKNHKMVTVEYDGKMETHRCFKSWVKKTVPCEDKSGYYRQVEFGWKPVWIAVDDFVNGHSGRYLVNEYIKEIKDIDEISVP